MRALWLIVAALALPASASAQTVGAVTVSESAGVAVVPVALSAAPATAVDVAWRTAESGIADAPAARAGVDYVAASGVVHFEPGETVKEVAITVLDNAVDGWGGFFDVVAGESTGFVQIIDDEPSPAPSIADAVVKENAGSVTLTVTRPFGTELGAMRYAWVLRPGESRVRAATGEVIFASSDTAKTIAIPIRDNQTPEDDQTFTVELTAAQPLGWGVPPAPPPARAVASVTVQDDDSVVVRKSGRVLVGPDATVVDVRRGEATFRGSVFSGAVFKLDSASQVSITGPCGTTLWVHGLPGMRVRGGRLTTVAVTNTATWSIRNGCERTAVRVLAGRVRVGTRVLRAGRRATAPRPSA